VTQKWHDRTWPCCCDLWKNLNALPCCNCQGTHQIRCHLAHLGHPLVGDTKYGGLVSLWCDRLPLHCLSLEAKGLSGDTLTTFAPIPEDLLLALLAMCDGELQREQWQQLCKSRAEAVSLGSWGCHVEGFDSVHPREHHDRCEWKGADRMGWWYSGFLASSKAGHVEREQSMWTFKNPLLWRFYAWSMLAVLVPVGDFWTFAHAAWLFGESPSPEHQIRIMRSCRDPKQCAQKAGGVELQKSQRFEV